MDLDYDCRSCIQVLGSNKSLFLLSGLKSIDRETVRLVVRGFCERVF